MNVGDRFGRWVVIALCPSKHQRSGQTLVKVACQCGRVARDIEVGRLNAGRTRQCKLCGQEASKKLGWGASPPWKKISVSGGG